MARLNPIDLLIIQLSKEFKTDLRLERKVQLELEKLVSLTYQDSILQKNGWCMRLKTPHVAVINLFDKCHLNSDIIKRTILDHFNIPGNPYKWGNPYYHILLLLILYGIKYNNKSLAKNATILILVKLWNGRRTYHIPFCDPDTMKYVVAHLSKKSYFKKFDAPIIMLINHFTPTLLKKYGDQMKRNSDVMKHYFDQAYTRLRQLFVQNTAPDIKTGVLRARGGIAPLYFAAKEKGYKLSSSKQFSDMDDSNVVEFYSSGEFDEIIENITNSIVMNITPIYSASFLNFIHQQSSVNVESIKLLTKAFHSIKYQKHIREILELIIRQLQLSNKFDVCKANFLSDVIKRKIISSKHSKHIVQLKAIADDLVERIFKDKITYVKYSRYSYPIKGQLRKVIIYTIVYDLQRFICSNF